MITLSFFQSIEFYVIAFTIAAMIVAFSMKPAPRGEVKTHLLAGNIFYSSESHISGIEMYALENGTVRLIRHGIAGVYSNGAVSLAVNVKGFDITIEERIVCGNDYDINAEPINTAEFILDFLGAERYHIRYNSDSTGLFAVTTFNNREGYKVAKELKHFS